MADLLYLTNMAHTCRRMAMDAGEPETAFNLFELARIYDQQVSAATERSITRKRAMVRLVRSAGD